MTRLLASVNSLDEARIALRYADIIDLKQPEQGALGALDVATITAIVAECKGRRPLSATIGDLPFQPECIIPAVQRLSKTGVDYIKIGFFPHGDIANTLLELSQLSAGQALIAVLFADTQFDFEHLKFIQSTGFKGVMLDTLDKTQGSLLNVMALPRIEEFVSLAKMNGLLCGLAGSLTCEDIPVLLPLATDYLGFRGALCEHANRVARLSEQRLAQVKAAISHDTLGNVSSSGLLCSPV